jgi:hypothetical protein
MFFLQEGFTYRNFLMDLIGVFFFIVWFWLLITVFADLFRRHDISGWIKAIWSSIDRLFIHRHPGIFDFSGTRHGRAQCAARRGGA